jgi:hypothetical protein
VQDLLVHERDSDLVIGTHGRGIFAVDIAPLRQITDEVRAKKSHLFEPENVLFGSRAGSMFDEFQGFSEWVSLNPQPAPIAYYLREESAEPVTIEVLSATGQVLQKIDGKKAAGIHYVNWNMRGAAPGSYGVRLTAGGETTSRTLTVAEW